MLFNTGVMTQTQGAKIPQGYEIQWGTNVFGHSLLQKLMMPLLHSSASDIAEVQTIWVHLMIVIYLLLQMACTGMISTVIKRD
jgi:hypothetical protein